MTSDALLLIRNYLKLDWRKAFDRSGVLLLLIYLLVIAGAIGLAVGSGFAGYGVGYLVNTPDIPFNLGRGVFPGVLLTIVFIGVLVTGLNQAVRSLYLSGDLEQLVVAPIKTRSIMVAKLMSRMPWNVIFLLVIVAPALVTYGLGISAGPGYYLSGVFLVIIAPLFGLSIGALIAMFLVRWLPAQRLSELLAAAYAVLGLSIGLLAQLPRFFTGTDSMDAQDLESINAALDSVTNAPIPTFWAGQGMVDLGTGDYGLGLGRMIAYLVLTLGLFIFTMFVADRLYLPGWLRMQGAAGKRRSLADESGRLRGGSLRRVMGVKDWLLRIRDPRQLVSLVGSLFFIIIILALAVFRGYGDDPGLMEASQSGALAEALPFRFLGAAFSPGVLVCALIVFVSLMVFGSLSLSSLALEGKSFDVLKAAPISGRMVWWSKNYGIILPYAVFVTVMLIAAWFVVHYSLGWGLYGWIVLLIAGCGFISTNVSLGFRYADFDWQDPRKMTTGGGGLLSLILGAVYLIILGVVSVGFFVAGTAFPSFAIPAALVGLLIIGVGTWLWMRVQANWADRVWSSLVVD